MRSRLDLTLFAHICARPDEELDLGEAALLIGAIEEPSLDISRWIGVLDDLGRGARRALDRDEATFPTEPVALARKKLESVIGFLYGHKGFRGNRDDYYDPRNSFLHEVLMRRTGIPITLGVCRRADIPASGVSFPGHFLVRSDGPGNPLFVDPFAGALLSRQALTDLYARITGEAREPPPQLLTPATKQQILLRMLNNLHGIYATRADREHLTSVLERIHALSPSKEVERALERLGGTTPFGAPGKRSIH